jgi:hypothetical protein
MHTGSRDDATIAKDPFVLPAKAMQTVTVTHILTQRQANA